jgi:hypothetical protein
VRGSTGEDDGGKVMSILANLTNNRLTSSTSETGNSVMTTNQQTATNPTEPKSPDVRVAFPTIAKEAGATPQPPEPKIKKPELTLHPFCTIIPQCTEKEFGELKEDIKNNGLRVPIKTFEGKILDGRSRYKACVELEKEDHRVELRTEDFQGTQSSDALAYVISMNVKRRHLSPSQRALIAARDW